MAKKTTAKKMTLVVFSGDLDKVLASFFLATAAASMGMKVTMYFTFWGLNVLKKDGPLLKGGGIKQKMLNLLNRGGADRLPLSKLNMFGMGSWMMKQLMKEHNVLSIKEQVALAKKSRVKLVACSSSMEIMGLKKGDLINEVSEIAGATAYLDAALEADINLFI